MFTPDTQTAPSLGWKKRLSYRPSPPLKRDRFETQYPSPESGLAQREAFLF